MKTIDMTEYRKAYYRKNKDSMIASSMRFHRKNRKARLRKMRAYTKKRYYRNRLASLMRSQLTKLMNPRHYKKYGALYYRANQQRVKASVKKWRGANKSYLAQKRAEDVAKNAAKIIRYTKKYYRENKELCLFRKRQWRKKNARKVQAYNQKYYQRMKTLAKTR